MKLRLRPAKGAQAEPPPGRLASLALYTAARAFSKPKLGLRYWRGERFEAFMYVGRPVVYSGSVETESEIRASHYVSWCGRDYRIPAMLHVRILDGEWLKRRTAKLALEKVERAAARLSPALAEAARLAWDSEYNTFTIVDSTLTPIVEPEFNRCGLRLTLVSLYPSLFAAFELAGLRRGRGR